MPVSPDLAEQAAKAALELYAEAETTMLATVARRLERGIDSDGWAETKLLDTQRLRADIESQLEQLRDRTDEAVADGVTTAYNRGVASAGSDLTKAGTERAIAYAPVDLGRVQPLVLEAVTRLQSTHLRVLRATLDAYRDVIYDATAQVAAGTVTRRQAAQRALDGFARRGIRGYVDTAGRSWELPSYAEMAVRTTAGHAAVQGHLDRLTDSGHDLVIVSDAPQECPTCRPWEGKVLSITGAITGRASGPSIRGSGTVTVDVAGTVAEATTAGLFHPNCRHSTGLYLPGVTRPLTRTADPEGDAARQELRRLERGTREWKRREAVAITDDAKRQARAKTREWQGRIREHTAATPAKRQRAREQIGAAR